MSLRINKRLLIDGDILVYRYACACKGDTLSALHDAIDISISLMRTKLLSSIYEIYLSGNSNFRYKIAQSKPYKGNRKGNKPKYYQEARNYLLDKHKALVANHGLEADDMLSIRAKELVSNFIICSIDKDLLQVQGEHYNFNRDILTRISKIESYRNLFKQIIIGDSVDNIPGLPGFGIKAASALDNIENIDEMYSYIVNLYHDNNYSKEYMDEQASLVYLLRSREDSWSSFQNKERGVSK